KLQHRDRSWLRRVRNVQKATGDEELVPMYGKRLLAPEGADSGEIDTDRRETVHAIAGIEGAVRQKTRDAKFSVQPTRDVSHSVVIDSQIIPIARSAERARDARTTVRVVSKYVGLVVPISEIGVCEHEYAAVV